MSDHLVSLIRTYVPIVVGAALGWLIAAGVDVDPATRDALVAGIVGLTTAAYYGLVRALEARWPALGILLGSTKAPTYGPSSADRARPPYPYSG